MTDIYQSEIERYADKADDDDLRVIRALAESDADELTTSEINGAVGFDGATYRVKKLAGDDAKGPEWLDTPLVTVRKPDRDGAGHIPPLHASLTDAGREFVATVDIDAELSTLDASDAAELRDAMHRLETRLDATRDDVDDLRDEAEGDVFGPAGNTAGSKQTGGESRIADRVADLEEAVGAIETYLEEEVRADLDDYR